MCLFEQHSKGFTNLCLLERFLEKSNNLSEKWLFGFILCRELHPKEVLGIQWLTIQGN